jgi:hypothetical protein
MATMRLEGLGKVKKKKNKDLTGNRTRDLQACSILPKPATVRCVPLFYRELSKEKYFIEKK